MIGAPSGSGLLDIEYQNQVLHLIHHHHETEESISSGGEHDSVVSRIYELLVLVPNQSCFVEPGDEQCSVEAVNIRP